MITEEKKYRVGQLIVFGDDHPFQRHIYEITRILKGQFIQINRTSQDRYTPAEFQARKPVIVGEVKRVFGIFRRRIYY